MLKIGNLSIHTPIFLAPMAGVTDYSFRIICKEHGAGIVYSEFVSAHGIIRKNEKTLDMIKFTDEERPIGIQIFGDEPEVMAKAARFVADQFKPDIIDINYGCPVPKITKRGAGSAALKDLCLMEEITSAVVESVPQLPVTVKMRAGWDSQRIIVEKAGNQLENAGVKAITLHPRTTKQYFTGKADWSLIKILKQAVSIPVVGNGDIGTADDVKRMFEETGCDAVMIGRAALGNPWIFGEIKSIFENTALPPAPLVEDRISTCKRHLNLLVENRGERVGLNLMRKHFGWYIKNFPGAGEFRKELVTALDSKTALEKLDKLAVVQL
tara:strand:+ start:691 stop:1665 length:975 start_codon:yes stop_codon:yes gene_type:complete